MDNNTDNNSLVNDFSAWNQSSPGSVQLQKAYITRLSRRGDLLTIDAQEISQFLNNPKWKANTRVSAYGAVKKFYWWMQKVVRYRVDDPMDFVFRPRPQKGVPRPVPEDSLDSSRNRAPSSRELLMFNLAAMQGLRRAEIATLKVSDIDFARNILVIEGKGGKVREVPLHDTVKEQLLIAVSSAPGTYIFPRANDPDQHLVPTTVGRKLSAMLDRKYTGHQLRHRFATAVYQSSGHDIRVTQELLGHASVATTQVYTAISKDSLRNAVSNI